VGEFNFNLPQILRLSVLRSFFIQPGHYNANLILFSSIPDELDFSACSM
jgi:hypothetical protein